MANGLDLSADSHRVFPCSRLPSSLLPRNLFRPFSDDKTALPAADFIPFIFPFQHPHSCRYLSSTPFEKWNKVNAKLISTSPSQSGVQKDIMVNSSELRQKIPGVTAARNSHWQAWDHLIQWIQVEKKLDTCLWHLPHPVTEGSMIASTGKNSLYWSSWVQSWFKQQGANLNQIL